MKAVIPSEARDLLSQRWAVIPSPTSLALLRAGSARDLLSQRWPVIPSPTSLALLRAGSARDLLFHAARAFGD
jgi:hypothetical protein